MLKVLLELAKKLMDNGELVSFGYPVGSQINIFEYKTKEGISVLDKFYDGSRSDAILEMLDSGLCYVEYPSSRWSNGEQVVSYDKYLATRSESLIRAWLGVEVLPERYTRNFGKVVEKGYSFIVKPVMGNGKDKPNKITVPTKPINLEDEKLRIYPVPVLVYLFKKVSKMAEDGLIQFEYLKDNRTKRVLNSTTSREILDKIYNNEKHIDMMLESVTKDITKSNTLERGYVRVIEADSSKYDTGVRALNLARVYNVKPLDFKDLDLTYINVDLNSVVGDFSVILRKLTKSQLLEVAKALESWKYRYQGGYSVHDLESWVVGKEALHSTTFRKDLYDLMVSLPHLFNLESIKEVEVKSETVQDDLEVFEDDFSIFD